MNRIARTIVSRQDDRTTVVFRRLTGKNTVYTPTRASINRFDIATQNLTVDYTDVKPRTIRVAFHNTPRTATPAQPACNRQRTARTPKTIARKQNRDRGAHKNQLRAAWTAKWYAQCAKEEEERNAAIHAAQARMVERFSKIDILIRPAQEELQNTRALSPDKILETRWYNQTDHHGSRIVQCNFKPFGLEILDPKDGRYCESYAPWIVTWYPMIMCDLLTDNPGTRLTPGTHEYYAPSGTL